jgi:Domain of Unknown Function with PDB structure (DUF3857)
VPIGGAQSETCGRIDLYDLWHSTYTAGVPLKKYPLWAVVGFALMVGALLAPESPAQNSAPASPAPAEKPAALPAVTTPAQIELLETRIRFEANGDSRKEVHARVRINSELGVGQFAHLKFDYDRAFDQIEIPLLRITHASEGTADILPSAISDQPNAAVVDAPGYHDVRSKSVRILGLAPSDVLEYRVVTTTSRRPLAPDFWLDHAFDHTGVVSREIFELDLPDSRPVNLQINPDTPATSTEKSGDGDSARTVYRWERVGTYGGGQDSNRAAEEAVPDIAMSTVGWQQLSIRLGEGLNGTFGDGAEIRTKALELIRSAKGKLQQMEALYDFVSQKIATIELPLGSTGFSTRPPADILKSGYATPEDKFALFAALAATVNVHAHAALTGYCDAKGVARPTAFTHLLVAVADGGNTLWLDPSLEVAPFGVISVPGKCAFVLAGKNDGANAGASAWQTVAPRFPFPSFQRVKVEATLAADGTLNAKVRYVMRGENELLLRVAFHQSSREKWKDVAQLLSLSDGFRGKIISATATDPYATKTPFSVEYEITQAKFVDWSKKPVRIPALLPILSLPDPPAAMEGGAAIVLGIPLDVETRLTLRLPDGTSAEVPTGTVVDRDYATFASRYGVEQGILSATRHINFLLREVPAARRTDYNAFLHAVQTDEAQRFMLMRAEDAGAAGPKP